MEIAVIYASLAGSKVAHPHLMMYKCVAKPWVMRLGALLLGAASFMVVWSEATIGLGRKPDVSPFSLVTTPLPHPPPPNVCIVYFCSIWQLFHCVPTSCRL